MEVELRNWHNGDGCCRHRYKENSMKRRNFGFTLSEDAASYLTWLREERSTNLSKFVEKLILNAAADDDGYNPCADWLQDDCQYHSIRTEDGKSHD